MAPSNRPDYKLNLEGLPQLNMHQTRSANTSQANSPIEAPAGSGLRYPLGNGLGGAGSQAGTGRAGAGSPSKEYTGSRLFPKRAREIQQQEGLTPPIWGPPTTGSGHSTPLRETIPESPGSDSFPDFDAGQATGGSPNPTSSSTRRTRAGTVPSRFPAMSVLNGSQSLPRSGQATPSSSPYGGGSPSHGDTTAGAARGPPTSNAALLSRLRAGSMPQRPGILGSSPFGNSLFASSWLAGRERASTLQSIRSSDGPSSPNGSPADGDVRTLDYLGLVDAPQSGRNSLSQVNMDMLMNQQRQNGVTIADLAALNAFNNKNTANRFRSYSVNAKEKYANVDQDDLDEYELLEQQLYANGTMTPTTEATAAQAAAIHEAVRQHNLEVQAFANYASASRPRARTAGVLDSPSSRVLRNYMPTPSRLDSSMTAADLQSNDGSEYGNLAAAVHNMNLNKKGSYDNGMDHGNLESPTRSLWLGNIPSSTTVSSLNVIFGQFGPIEFARVLTHKSCGFVNFENIQSAISAKATCNGKEIFPGCGPVRIGFAKEQSASNTPGANGAFPSPSPDPFVSKTRGDGANAGVAGNINAETAAAALVTPDLLELREEIADIVQQFGAGAEEQARIDQSLEFAMSYDEHMLEIPPIPEPSHNRVHDAPRLREIRKRIDNNSISPVEIETIAMEMLPEIAELASDYLGNTVVQKLFENCSEETKEAMLAQIAPHLAEIGVHKNGTWAAQKIIDVARTPAQMTLIVDALKPHGVNLFLDQYGNYVMQCCLRFQAPLNNFIFNTMLSRLWDVSQGRFGARAMRACLESHFATNDQKRLMAAAIALHSVQLATNSNGALLLTWFLDTCTYPRRRSVLAPRIIPHLVHLCTHKVAYLTVLKIINQRNESDARDSILRALFYEEQTLYDVVSDQACGATFVFKVLTTPFLDESMRPECLENVRNVLIRLKAAPSQGYKRLMDEVGMSTRHGGTPVSHESRSQSRSRQPNGHLPHLDTQNGYQRPGYAGPQHIDPSMGAGLQRTISMESNGFDPYAQQYTHSPAMSNAGISPINVQYQQAMMAQAQGGMARPPGFYGSPAGMSPYGAASPAPQMVDPYRQNLNASPMLPPGMGMQPGYQQQAFGSPMLGMPGTLNGYGYMPQQQYFPQGQMQQQGHMNGNGRRGRNNRNNYGQ
ncbi:putative RNA recognition motif domain, armadillo-like helical, pumilio domain-containing protein [Septoria linicola]|nr:putative RNA recognition motif domain, armadillo-like helical, pumilio domain-containing protein [Septoria linicola]